MKNPVSHPLAVVIFCLLHQRGLLIADGLMLRVLITSVPFILSVMLYFVIVYVGEVWPQNNSELLFSIWKKVNV